MHLMLKISSSFSLQKEGKEIYFGSSFLLFEVDYQDFFFFSSTSWQLTRGLRGFGLDIFFSFIVLARKFWVSFSSCERLGFLLPCTLRSSRVCFLFFSLLQSFGFGFLLSLRSYLPTTILSLHSLLPQVKTCSRKSSNLKQILHI